MILLCDIGRQRIALPLEAVVEVVAATAPTPVPGAPAAVLGVLRLRNEVVPVIDLGAVAARGNEPVAATEPLAPTEQFVVARHAGRRVALRVRRAEWLPDEATRLSEASVRSGDLAVILAEALGTDMEDRTG